MEYYYFFTILSSFIFLLNKKLNIFLIIFGCSFFLFYLPSIGFYGPDYWGYFSVYKTAYFTPEYPWFMERGKIDSEPLYLRYTSFFAYIFPYGFSSFMIINYLFSVLLSFFAFRSFKKDVFYLFWIYVLPVIFPTIFYYLLRSSLSFFFVLIGFTFLFKKNKIWGILFLFIGINLHSQYILESVLSMITVILFFRYKNEKFYARYIVISTLILLGILANDDLFFNMFSDILSYLPSSNIAVAKLGNLEINDHKGFRLTSILSIFVYPIMMFYILKYKNKDKINTIFFNNNEIDTIFIYVFLAIIMYGAVINIAFFNNTHLAGRLARFSDYLGMCILLPVFFKYFIGHDFEKVAIIILALITPFLYPAVYMNTIWGF